MKWAERKKNDIHMMHDPKFRARAVTIFFTIAFVILGPFHSTVFTNGRFAQSGWAGALPILIFLALLLIHTYHAVRSITSITPPRLAFPHLYDAALVVAYLALPVSLWYGSVFYLVATFLFAVASMKYALLLGRTTGETLIRKKLIVDIGGVLGCLTAYTGDVMGMTRVTDWVFSLGFIAASVYLFYIRPLYIVPIEHGQSANQPS
jgi:hypothetical protein